MVIKSQKITLRTVLPSDADLLYKWENDRSNWDVSGTKKPFTKKEIQEFIANQKDIYLDKQLRLMISLEKTSIGCIDLFEFDKDNSKAGVGILIEKAFRKKGHASEALSLLIEYSFKTLRLQELFCSISEDNKPSMKLFQKNKFKITQTNKNICSLKLLHK